jgi:uncharacterized protein involved in response to NO
MAHEIDPNLTVAEILRRIPAARPILAAHGFDACCGGSHPLTQACAAHGVPVERVVLQISEARALSVERPATCSAGAPDDMRFSPGFLIASLLITLTLGAGSGLFYLWRMGLGADVPLSHRQIHAHSQVFGFAALFVMGIAFHALPRMLGARPASAGMRNATLWLMVSGVLLRNLGQPFAFFAAGGAVTFALGLLEAAAGTLFALWVIDALARPRGVPAQRGPADPLRVFLPIATAALLTALALSVAQGAWIAAHRDATLPGSLTEPFYVVSLYGFVLASIFAFAGRMAPVFLGIGPARRGTFRASAVLLSLGVALACASCAPFLADVSAGLRDAGAFLLASAAVTYLAGCGILWRRARNALLPAAGSPGVAIRLAFSSLALWALLNAASVAVARLTVFPARNPWWADAARHVFTIGFLTLLIVGISFRVLPVFSGKKLFSPRLARLTYALIVLGVAMRLLQYPAAFRPVLYAVSSYMGVPVVAALVLFMVNLMRTVRPSRAAGFAATLPGRS